MPLYSTCLLWVVTLHVPEARRALRETLGLGMAFHQLPHGRSATLSHLLNSCKMLSHTGPSQLKRTNLPILLPWSLSRSMTGGWVWGRT